MIKKNDDPEVPQVKEIISVAVEKHILVTPHSIRMLRINMMALFLLEVMLKEKFPDKPMMNPNNFFIKTLILFIMT